MRHLLITGLLGAWTLAGCRCEDLVSSGKSPPSSSPSSARKEESLPLVIAYGSEKKLWLEEQARSFIASRRKTKSGKLIRVEGRPMGSGEAVQGILTGSLKPHVFSPASGAYISLLNQNWLSIAGHTKPLSPAGDPVVLSPMVIAIWKPMAQALGWPGKPLGWADLLRVSGDSKGWGSFDHPEWGGFKLGHTHPEFSNSGILSVLAEAYAGAKKTRGLNLEDLDSKKTQSFIRSVESTIVHYGKSTGFFADKMVERGPTYLSAAVLYENLVIESYSKPSPSGFPIVALYPREGTFWSDHPYAILDADWVDADSRDAAEQFLTFLKAKPAQERALELGFRPADASIPIRSPVDSDHGVDPKQPQTLLEVPAAPVLKRLLEIWKTAKRRTDVVLVFDKSGSMQGRPLAQAKQGAKAFLGTLQDQDQATLIFFDHRVFPPIGPLTLDRGRSELLSRIDTAIADGGTSLYEAIAVAYKAALARAREDPARIHALVVMTDGRDESSRMTLDDLRRQLTTEDSPVRVFTIAYGDQADPKVLERIAEAAKGTSAKGTAENIVQVYEEMASFF
jgi:Ca-activated chloride channel family protein